MAPLLRDADRAIARATFLTSPTAVPSMSAPVRRNRFPSRGASGVVERPPCRSRPDSLAHACSRGEVYVQPRRRKMTNRTVGTRRRPHFNGSVRVFARGARHGTRSAVLDQASKSKSAITLIALTSFGLSLGSSPSILAR